MFRVEGKELAQTLFEKALCSVPMQFRGLEWSWGHPLIEGSVGLRVVILTHTLRNNSPGSLRMVPFIERDMAKVKYYRDGNE